MATYSKQYFYGGQTQDDRLGGDTGFLYGENINPFNSTGYVELSKKPQNVFTRNTTIDDIIFDYDIGTEKIFLDKDGAVFNWEGTVIFRISDVLGSTKRPLHCFQYGGNGYFSYSSSGYLSLLQFPLPTTSTATTLPGSIVAPYTGFSGTSAITTGASTYAIAQIGNIFYLGVGDNISVYDFGDNSITTYDFWGEDIVGIEYADTGGFKVFLRSGKIFIWDGVSEGPGDPQELGDNIVGTSKIGNTTIIFGGSYDGLGTLGEIGKPSIYELSQGFKKLFTLSYSEILGQSKYRIVWKGIKSVAKIHDFFAFIERDDNTDDRLIIYGNMPGLPRAYIVLNTKASNGEAFGNITGLSVNGSKLFIYFNNSTRGVDYIDFSQYSTAQYNTTGYIITNVEDMGDKVIRKAKCQLHTRLSGITPTRNVVISSNTNYAGFNTVATVTSLDESEIDRQSTIGDYRDICFKYVLNSDGEVSPRLYGLKLEYEPQGL